LDHHVQAPASKIGIRMSPLRLPSRIPASAEDIDRREDKVAIEAERRGDAATPH